MGLDDFSLENLGWSAAFIDGFLTGFGVVMFLVLCMLVGAGAYYTFRKPNKESVLALVVLVMMAAYGLLSVLHMSHGHVDWDLFVGPPVSGTGGTFGDGLMVGLWLSIFSTSSVTLVYDGIALGKNRTANTLGLFLLNAIIWSWSVSIIFTFGFVLPFHELPSR